MSAHHHLGNGRTDPYYVDAARHGYPLPLTGSHKSRNRPAVGRDYPDHIARSTGNVDITASGSDYHPTTAVRTNFNHRCLRRYLNRGRRRGFSPVKHGRDTITMGFSGVGVQIRKPRHRRLREQLSVAIHIVSYQLRIQIRIGAFESYVIHKQGELAV